MRHLFIAIIATVIYTSSATAALKNTSITWKEQVLALCEQLKNAEVVMPSSKQQYLTPIHFKIKTDQLRAVSTRLHDLLKNAPEEAKDEVRLEVKAAYAAIVQYLTDINTLYCASESLAGKKRVSL